MKKISREIELYQLENSDFGSEFATKCIEKNIDINVDYEWYEHIIEDFKTIVELIGFYDVECYFSGFWSQGDGASFKGRYSTDKRILQKIKSFAPKDEELHRIAKELQSINNKCKYDLSFSINKSGRYEHEYTMSVSDIYSDTVSEDKAYSFEDELLELSRDLARWLHETLYSEYDYLTSDKVVFETLISNEYEFDEAGNIA